MKVRKKVRYTQTKRKKRKNESKKEIKISTNKNKERKIPMNNHKTTIRSDYNG